jgi:hypothetical protein
MAIVRSNADQGRDYIANFEPFAIDRLKAWPVGEPVGPDSLARAICSEWGVPSLPTAVGKILLRRAEQRGEVISAEDGRVYPNYDKLVEAADLVAQRNEMLARMRALAGAVVTYAKTAHGLSWSEKDATDALERLTEDFGADLALAKRQGLAATSELPEGQALTVVYGFARHAVESDPMNFGYLEEMVRGTMLANAIYFEDVGRLAKRLRRLHVYLDTTPILRAMGLAAEPVADATGELLALLNDFKIPMHVFSHTVVEIGGVLDGVARSLRRGRSGTTQQGAISGHNREAIDALIRRGYTAGEIESIRAELESHIRALGITITDTPPHVELSQVDEARFDKALDDQIGYRWKGPREKDAKSLTAIDRLRGTSRPRELAQATALFVTSNSTLARVSREFFETEGRAAPIPHALHETALTAQLWVRAPHPPPDLPRKLLIADCFAALNPGPELWERWVAHIVRLQREGDITDEQVQNLIYHQQAKSKLFEVTHGNPDDVSNETVAEVLDRFESELRRPSEQRAAEDRARREVAEADAEQATGERDALRAQVEELTAWREAVNAEKEVAAARRQRQRRLAHAVCGVAAAVLVVAAFAVICIVLGEVHGKVGWAAAVTLLVFGAAAGIAWAAHLKWRFPFLAVVFAGAASALFVNVFSVVPDDASSRTQVPRHAQPK